MLVISVELYEASVFWNNHFFLDHVSRIAEGCILVFVARLAVTCFPSRDEISHFVRVCVCFVQVAHPVFTRSWKLTAVESKTSAI